NNLNKSATLNPTTNTITRSFSYPALTFQGDTSTTLTQTISWYQNGTVSLADNRGKHFAFNIPANAGTLTLLQNDTTVDQNFVSNGLQYDLYWKPIQNSAGYITNYKFTIIGSTTLAAGGMYKLVFPVNTIQNLTQKGNTFMVLTTSPSSVNSTSLEGIGIDWSDAVSSG